jgi:hypothetical protein
VASKVRGACRRKERVDNLTNANLERMAVTKNLWRELHSTDHHASQASPVYSSSESHCLWYPAGDSVYPNTNISTNVSNHSDDPSNGHIYSPAAHFPHCIWPGRFSSEYQSAHRARGGRSAPPPISCHSAFDQQHARDRAPAGGTGLRAGGEVLTDNYPKAYKIKVCSETGELGHLNYETKTDIIFVISSYRMQ